MAPERGRDGGGRRPLRRRAWAPRIGRRRRALRAEVNARRLGPSTRVLHIATSFQQRSSVPIGVFTGALETSISLHPELNIHTEGGRTEGGRQVGFDVLADDLRSDYGYVVLEPDGRPWTLPDRLERLLSRNRQPPGASDASA